MKLTKYLFPVVVFAAAMTSCDTCDLEPVIPPVKAPVDTTPANTTILELKQAYWTSDFKCVNQIGLNDRGDSILIRGRVISTDITGNLYQQVVLRDETAAVAIRVRNNNLHRVYPYGSELLINVTGMYIGMYGNGMQIGGKTSGEDTPQTLNEDVFKAAVKANGWPDTSLVQPIPVDGEFLKSMASSTEGKQEWQSQLVTIDGVTFDEPGAKFAAGTTSIISVYGRTDHGQLQMRFSGRSSFANMTIPSGSGSVTGILSYYNKDWQLIPCTLDDLKGFGGNNGGNGGNGGTTTDEPAGDGTEASPYNVAKVIALKSPGTTAWVKGYIVGVMNSSNDYTFETTAPFNFAANVYIADNIDETDTNKMLPIKLNAGSAARSAVNLMDNPGNIHKELVIEGTLSDYFKQPGVIDPVAYKLSGEGGGNGGGTVTPPSENVTLTKASVLTSGNYALWADDHVGLAYKDGYNYGYMQTAECVPASDGSISTTAANLYTFTQESKGWTIADSNGQYLYHNPSHNTFQLTKSPDKSDDYLYWTITANTDGTFTIVNNGSKFYAVYAPAYKTFACYSDASAYVLPCLYQSAK